MSAILRCKSKMKDKGKVLEALDKLRVPKETVFERNDRITVSQNYHHGRYPVSLYPHGEDNTYMVAYEKVDQAILCEKAGGVPFEQAVEQWYNACVAVETLEREGFYPSVSVEDGKIRVLAQG